MGNAVLTLKVIFNLPLSKPRLLIYKAGNPLELKFTEREPNSQ
jgi:hypothetical protein